MSHIILADNQDISRLGLHRILALNGNCEIISEVQSKIELLDKLITHPNSIIIIDYLLFDFRDANELIITHQRYPQTKWIVFSEDLSIDFIKSLIYSEYTFSIVTKNSTKEEIICALRESEHNRRYLCNSISGILIDQSRQQKNQPDKDILTPTEQEILKEIALGKTTKEIAVLRFLSTHTIMTHRKNIFRKLNVNNIHEATKFAIRAGLVDLAEYYI